MGRAEVEKDGLECGGLSHGISGRATIDGRHIFVEDHGRPVFFKFLD